MANVVKSQGKKPRTQAEVPPLPRLQGTYTQIIVNAIQSAQNERRFTEKLRSATRELAAMVPHTKEKWSALGVLGKVVTVITLLAIGGGATYLVMRGLLGPSKETLRAEITASIERQDFVTAKRKLDLLTSLENGISAEDRWQLLGTVQGGLNRIQHELQMEFRGAVSAEQWDKALAALDKMDNAEILPEWSLFTRAETLRKAGRHQEARTFFARYVEIYPTTERTDDALFWQAASLRDVGDTAAMRGMLEKLLADHPSSNFKSSAKRWIAELETKAP